jgi:hypothetical protein
MSTRSNGENYKTQWASYIQGEAGESPKEGTRHKGKACTWEERNGSTWLFYRARQSEPVE